MTPVRISVDAENDLDAIWLYIANDSPVNADRFLDRLIAALTTTLSTAMCFGNMMAAICSFPDWIEND